MLYPFLWNSLYRISSYSFRGSYPFLNLEIVENSNSCRNIWIFQSTNWFLLRKLFKGGNYSRAETIWGNTVDFFFHEMKLSLCPDNNVLKVIHTLKELVSQWETIDWVSGVLYFLICGANNVVEHYRKRIKILHPFEGWPNKAGPSQRAPAFLAEIGWLAKLAMPCYVSPQKDTRTGFLLFFHDVLLHY